MSVNKSDKNRVCVIGAGTAGLCALRHSISKGFNVVCYEKAKQIGGTWNYDENIEHITSEDEVQSSMYEGLRTNLPKEVMGYPDFLYPDDTEESYVPSAKVLNFLELYAKHFHLNESIKFQYEVIQVRPRRSKGNNEKLWEVYVKNLQTEEFQIEYFDFMFVCNGHYCSPEYPVIENMENFKGKQLHSHLYRKAKSFEDETVLIIGAGPSGIDIAFQLKNSAKRVFFSHHLEKIEMPLNIIQKPDVEHFTENGAVFKDGSIELFSVVIYCTGYKYKFPFLSIDCGIHIEEKSVQPLYKHVLNINYPSMAFIGIPFKLLPTQTFDLQTRFALRYFLNEKQISREDMLKDLKNEIQNRLESGLSLRQFHEMAKRQFDYYDDLATTAEIEPLKPVMLKMMKVATERVFSELQTFRDNRFKVIDDFNFEKFKINERNAVKSFMNEHSHKITPPQNGKNSELFC